MKSPVLRQARWLPALCSLFVLTACGEDADPKARPVADVTDTVTGTDAEVGTDAETAEVSGGSDVYLGDKDTWGRGKVRQDEVLAAGKGELKAGVAMRFLDGPVGVSMAGFGGRIDGRRTHWADRIKGSAGFYGMQSIKALVLEVGGQKMALVKSPMMSSESYLTDAIARYLKKDHNLDFEGRVITMAGHSHHATARYWPVPETLGNVGADSFDAEVTEAIAALFSDAIAEAYTKREPAEWGRTFEDNWDPKDEVYRDRRENNDPTYGKDPRLNVLGFRKKSDGTPMAVIMHFAIHGTVLGGSNDMFSEDAPGYVEHKFEELFFATEGKPVYGMYAQSSGGDASPAGDGLGHPDLARLERLGEAAAPKILKLYKGLQWSSETELAIRSERIQLVHERIYQGKPWQDEFETELGDAYIWGGWQCNAAGFKLGDSTKGKPKLCVDLGIFIELLEQTVPHNVVHETYITAARLGDLWLTTMPGEPTWSIVEYAKEEAAKRTWNGKPVELMVIGYAQDHLLYLSHPEDWYTGGYEAEMSLWGPGGGPFLADEGLGMLDAMIAGKNGPTFFSESPSLAPIPPFVPRAREKSLAAGTVVAQPKATVKRTETVEFAANCGDPGLGSPLVVVHKEEAGKFVPVPARHGWKDRFYDNSRYEMISVYDPDPPQLEAKTVPERTHLWRFLWQIPSDWPTGQYRLQLQCNVLKPDAAKAEGLILDSNAFAVGMADSTTLTASLSGTDLTVEMRLPGVNQTTAQSKAPGFGKWINAGYRLLDRLTSHTGLARVRANLKVEILDAQGAVLTTVDVPYDPMTDLNAVKLASAPAGAASVRAWIAGDVTPGKVTSAIAP